jgi:hypothetical protein
MGIVMSDEEPPCTGVGVGAGVGEGVEGDE